MATPSSDKNESIDTQSERTAGRPFGTNTSATTEGVSRSTRKDDDRERDFESDRRQHEASLRRGASSLLGSAKNIYSSVDSQVRAHPAGAALLFAACGAATAFVLRRQSAPSRSERLHDALLNLSDSVSKSTTHAAHRASEGASNLGRNLSAAGHHSMETAKQSPLLSSAAALATTTLIAGLVLKNRRSSRDYEECSYDELYEMAKKRDISGRSRMNRDELVAALQGH